MGFEENIINIISGIMPRSERQINKSFEADSEIIEYNGSKLLFNIDEFSQEDMMRDNDPYTLGWNIAVGAISDIFATGGKPLFYLHSLVINSNWSDDYVRLFSLGVSDVLKEAGASFIGGDFGKSDVWRCTAAVVGEAQGKYLMRSSTKTGDIIYLSGEAGLGNLEAMLKLISERKKSVPFLNHFKNRFPIRNKEAELIRQFATSCIDTSDGVFNALNSISEMSNTGYEVQGIPYIKAGLMLSKIVSMPKTLLFLGECGEYELLFTIDKESEKEFLMQAGNRKLRFYRIGQVTESLSRVLNEDGRNIDLSGLIIGARDFECVEKYLEVLTSYIKE